MFTRRFSPSLVLSFFSVAVILVFAPVLRAANPGVNPKLALTGQRVLILGDSITQNGRYVDFIEYYLHQIAPGEKTDLISIGLSSETVSGLSEKNHPYPRPCVIERLDRALKATKPQVVLACYGMNDGIYHPRSAERLAAFNAGLRQLITQVRTAGAQLVLLTPTVFDSLPIRARTVSADAREFGYSKPFGDYDTVLAEFSRAELALREPGVTVIDLHGPLIVAIARQRERDPTFTFSPDGIHPNDAGHLVVARTILQGLGYVVPESASELASSQADPVFALIRDRRQLRSEAWLPFVGYTREERFRSASVAAAERAVARLQDEIDAAVKVSR